MDRSALLFALTLFAAAAVSPEAAGPPNAGRTAGAETGQAQGPLELDFTKGDTRLGAKVRIRVSGDSVHYSRTTFEPGRNAVESLRSAPLDARRRLALKRIMGELPRFRVFGSCFGKGMRYYLIDTPAGKFYRSLPESSGRCFADEPDIWPLLEDLDTFIAPPEDPGQPEYSTAPARALTG